MLAIIKNKETIAEKTILVEFKLAEGKLDFIPGQFFSLQLIDPIYPDQEKGDSRYFTIIYYPGEDKFGIATRLTGSYFKKSLAESPIDAEVEVSEPIGEFVLPRENIRPLVFVAGGIGITPFVSMLRQIDNENIDCSIDLIYINRSSRSASFMEELNAMGQRSQWLNLILVMTDDESWPGEKDKISKDFLNRNIDNFAGKDYFVAGPPRMVQAVIDELKRAGIKDGQIRSESFSGYF